MREIKYKAWDKKAKVMRKVLQIDWDYKEVIFERYEMYGDEQIIWKNFKDLELIEYTGLKDKNGKEIYEGDIIRVISYDVYGEDKSLIDTDFTAKIVFSTKNRFPSSFDMKVISEKKGSGFYSTSGDLKGDVYEVIGNIYENPELIKGENVLKKI